MRLGGGLRWTPPTSYLMCVMLRACESFRWPTVESLQCEDYWNRRHGLGWENNYLQKFDGAVARNLHLGALLYAFCFVGLNIPIN